MRGAGAGREARSGLALLDPAGSRSVGWAGPNAVPRGCGGGDWRSAEGEGGEAQIRRGWGGHTGPPAAAVLHRASSMEAKARARVWAAHHQFLKGPPRLIITKMHAHIYACIYVCVEKIGAFVSFSRKRQWLEADGGQGRREGAEEEITLFGKLIMS